MIPLTDAQAVLLQDTLDRQREGAALHPSETGTAQALIRRGLAWRKSGPRPRLYLTQAGKDLIRCQ